MVMIDDDKTARNGLAGDFTKNVLNRLSIIYLQVSDHVTNTFFLVISKN